MCPKRIIFTVNFFLIGSVKSKFDAQNTAQSSLYYQFSSTMFRSGNYST